MLLHCKQSIPDGNKLTIDGKQPYLCHGCLQGLSLFPSAFSRLSTNNISYINNTDTRQFTPTTRTNGEAKSQESSGNEAK
jgi:hypothetical protein